MPRKKTKIKYSLMCRDTNSVIIGITFVTGTFPEAADNITGILKRGIPNILKKNHTGEDPTRWQVLGFQPWSSWAKRKRRASLAMAK